MNRRLLSILGGSTERYPYALENKFPRILNMIMSLWDKDEIDEYLMELMVSKRPNRAGFPPDVAADIMHLSLLHAMQDDSTSHEDVWDEIAAESSENLTPQRNGNWSEPCAHVGRELNSLNIPCTPEGLFESLQTGNSAAVNLFLEAEVSTEIRNKRGWTPSIAAGFYGHDGVLDLLLHRKCDVNAQDMDGNTALHWAAFNGHMPSAILLIEHHAKTDVQNNSGCTPLMQATAHNHLNIVTRLIAAGANLDSTADDGYTALHQAAASGHLEIVKSLLAHGAAGNLRAIDENTPYTLAVKNGQTEVIKLLSLP